MNARCRSCNAPIRWARTPAGKAMPLDARPTLGGNVLLREATPPADPTAQVLAGVDLADAHTRGRELYVPHFTTCPEAAKWRRPR